MLTIEDILPFFPDFVVIDSFKREICVSLEEYNGKIEGLRKEMEDYTLSSEAVQVRACVRACACGCSCISFAHYTGHPRLPNQV